MHIYDGVIYRYESQLLRYTFDKKSTFDNSTETYCLFAKGNLTSHSGVYIIENVLHVRLTAR